MEIKTLIDSFVDIRSMMTNLFGYIFDDGALENTSVDNIEEESFVEKEEKAAIAYFDITTGEFLVREFVEGDIFYQLLGELGKVQPKEFILEEELY